MIMIFINNAYDSLIQRDSTRGACCSWVILFLLPRVLQKVDFFFCNEGDLVVDIKLNIFVPWTKPKNPDCFKVSLLVCQKRWKF